MDRERLEEIRERMSLLGDRDGIELIDALDRSEALVARHAAELNRRRAESSVSHELLTELGVAREMDGTSLTLRQRIGLSKETAKSRAESLVHRLIDPTDLGADVSLQILNEARIALGIIPTP